MDVSATPLFPTWRTVAVECSGGETQPGLVLVERSTRRPLETPRDYLGLAVSRVERPTAVTFVFESSRFMEGTSPQAAELVVRILFELRPSDRVRFVFFHEEVQINDFMTVGDFVRSVTLRHLRRAACGSGESSQTSESVLGRSILRVREQLQSAASCRGPLTAGDVAALRVLDDAMAGLPADERLELEVEAVRDFVMRAQQPRRGADLQGALEEAVQGLLAPCEDGFIPALDANVTLLIFGSCRRYCVDLDWSTAAGLRCFLVQTWFVSPSGGFACAWSPPFDVRWASLSREPASRVAARIGTGLGSTLDVRFDLTRASLAKSGAVRVELADEDRRRCTLRQPKDYFLPREVVLGAARQAASDEDLSPVDRTRAMLRALAAENWAVREVLRDVAPGVVTEPVP